MGLKALFPALGLGFISLSYLQSDMDKTCVGEWIDDSEAKVRVMGIEGMDDGVRISPIHGIVGDCRRSLVFCFLIPDIITTDRRLVQGRDTAITRTILP